MNTLHPTRAHVIIHVDHRDLAMAYAQHTLTAPDYARAVVCRARTPNGFLDAMAAPTILRGIPDLPEEVVAALDGEPLADLVATLLGLTPTTQDDPDRIILRRMTFTAQDFFPDLDLDEVRVVEPHRDPARLGRRYVGWCADAAAPDTPRAASGTGPPRWPCWLHWWTTSISMSFLPITLREIPHDTAHSDRSDRSDALL